MQGSIDSLYTKVAVTVFICYASTSVIYTNVHCPKCQSQAKNAKTPERSTSADAPPSALEGGKFNARAPLPLPLAGEVD
jgi:hypothetical protein